MARVIWSKLTEQPGAEMAVSAVGRGQSNCIAWSNGSLTFTAHPPLPAQTVNREIKTQDYLLRLRDGWETGKRKIYETRAAKRAAFEEHQKLEREMRHLEGDPRKESSYRQRDESDDESSEDAQAYRDDMEEDFEIQHSPVLTTGMQAQGTRALRPRQAVLSKAPLIRKRKLDSELESQFDPSDRNRKQSRPNSD